MKTALVVGGTGPTGPHMVNGLIERGWKPTVLHGGFHEVEFAREIEHIHTDPHFRETLEPAIAGRRWDLVVFAYGRLRLAVELFRGRTDRLVAIGGATGTAAGPEDAGWGPMGAHANVDEDTTTVVETDAAANPFGFRMAQAEAALFDAHRAGHYAVTYVGFPILYGPRQPGPNDWSIVRRLLDGRRRLVIADGGLKLETRCYVENAAAAVLLAIDRPDVASGRKYVVSDGRLYTMRQRIETIARLMEVEVELVDMPWDLALPCHVAWRQQRGHRIRDTHRIRDELGYRDPVEPHEAMRRTVEWLLANPPEPGGEAEQQLGDPFDYAREDRLIDDWLAWRARLAAPDYPLPPPSHMYRHPKRPGEPWTPPSAPPRPGTRRPY